MEDVVIDTGSEKKKPCAWWRRAFLVEVWRRTFYCTVNVKLVVALMKALAALVALILTV